MISPRFLSPDFGSSPEMQKHLGHISCNYKFKCLFDGQTVLKLLPIL